VAISLQKRDCFAKRARNDKKMEFIIRNKRGYLLPLVIIYMIITMIVGAGILVLGSLDRIEANKRLHREQAFYLAEAGINWAYYRLKNNPAEDLNGSHNFGDVAFQISETVTRDTIVSTGTVKGVHETTAITVTQGSGIFGRGIFGSNTVTLANNAEVDSYDSRLGPYGGSNVGSKGNIGSNTNITLGNSSTVMGSVAVSAGGSISPVNAGSVGSTVTVSTLPLIYDAPLRTLNPVVIPTDLQSLNLPLSSYNSDPRITPPGNYTLVNGALTVNKPVTISSIPNGNFHFSQILLPANGKSQVNFTGDARIYLEGKLAMSNSSLINFGGVGILYVGTPLGQIAMSAGSSLTSTNPVTSAAGIYIASPLDQTFSNNSSALYIAVYAPSATVYLTNNSQNYGDIVANRVFLQPNAWIHFNIAFRGLFAPGDDTGGGIPNFISWTKPDWKK